MLQQSNILTSFPFF